MFLYKNTNKQMGLAASPSPNNNAGRNILVRILWIKYVINPEVCLMVIYKFLSD